MYTKVAECLLNGGVGLSSVVFERSHVDWCQWWTDVLAARGHW